MNDSLQTNEIPKKLTPKSSTEEICLSTNSSRITGFAKMSVKGRVHALMNKKLISQEEASYLINAGSLPLEQADKFIENCVGGFTLPLGIATNFIIDNEEVFIPMAVEESSVIAAASHGAKLARSGGGFFSEPMQTITTCQIQFFASKEINIVNLFSNAVKEKIFEIASACHPKLLERGGGVKDIELRILSKPGYYVIHIHVDTREAMGANIVNSIAEEVGRHLPNLLPCSVGSKILTNLALYRVIKAKCEVNYSALEQEKLSGEEVAKRICSVWEFADLDPFRAVTHNKGVMNGIDPVVIATGNDWRAVNAGCHAYASLTGTYKPLTRWFINSNNCLQGEIEVPIAVGTIGGVTRLHPSALTCLKLMGNPNVRKLSAIIASVGLAQNLSAIRALGCEGIQKGHMALHEKNIEMMKFYDHIPPLSAISSEV